MLETLITSKTRIKLLLKFFLNASNTGYLKNLEHEFDDSSNGIRLELNKLEQAGLLNSALVGNKKIFQANTKHPLFLDIHNIIMKYTGLDQIIETILNRLGNIEAVYLVGTLAKGLESTIIDLIIIGDINKEYLINLIDKAEPIIDKKIRYVLYQTSEFEKVKRQILTEEHLLIWNT
ncbi:MAG: ArsR family transcriptional regulator [bacterium]|jgi:predicted nucleotidyltransferase